MTIRPLIAALALVVNNAAFGAAQNPPSAPVTVVNTPSNPVPVRITNPTGEVNATVSGAVESADQNVVVFNGFIKVDSQTIGNANVENLSVKDFKEVRVIVYRSACGPCSTIEARIDVVGGVTEGVGFPVAYPIDLFVTQEATSPAASVFAPRTYTTPGEFMNVRLRATGPADNFAVGVLVIGRRN